MTAGLHTVKARLKMSLPPAQTKDIEAGVREYLNGMLLRCVASFYLLLHVL